MVFLSSLFSKEGLKPILVPHFVVIYYFFCLFFVKCYRIAKRLTIYFLASFLKIEFVKLYANEDFLSKFHNNIKNFLKDNHAIITRKNGIDYVLMKGSRKERALPVKPELGDFNLYKILDAKYMFI